MSKSIPSDTFPRATLKKSAPRPQSHARRKLSSASVVSTTSWVSMKMSLCSISSFKIPISFHFDTTWSMYM